MWNLVVFSYVSPYIFIFGGLEFELGALGHELELKIQGGVAYRLVTIVTKCLKGRKSRLKTVTGVTLT